jgi:GAF domain-containing protein
MNKVAHELTTIDLDSEFAFEKMAEQALRLACDLTGSSGGAVYLSTTSSDRLRFRRIAASEGEAFKYPTGIPFEKGNTLTWAVDQHRAYQQIGGSLTARNLIRAVCASGGIELVTPIAGPLGNTWAPAVGAIVLFHPHGDPRGYGSYERALVRNICLRIALARTNVATREIATAISILRSTSPQRLQIRKGPEYEAPAPVWPKDIGLAVTRFEQPLRRLAESTQSHSATLRMALSQHNNPDSYGFGLVRVAAYPEKRMDDPYKVLHDGDPGLHWYVMRSGQQSYVPRVGERHPRFPEVRPGTKSVLCVPVKVEGILAGTLNLESPFENNYAPFLPLVLALSGAVGRTLADARAQLEDAILDLAAQALDRRHDSSRELDEISENLQDLPRSPQRDSLLDQAEHMRSLVKDMRRKNERRPAPSSLWQIFETTVHKLGLKIHGCKPPKHRLFEETLDARACACLATMFQSVMYNLNQHSSPDAHDRSGRIVPRVRFEILRLQAVDQAVVILESLSSKYLTEELCAELYRYPIKSPNAELRLGTYIAGINARRIGARIHASLLEDSRTLRTTIIVPIEPLRAEGPVS